MSHEPFHRPYRANSALHYPISDSCINTLAKLDERLREYEHDTDPRLALRIFRQEIDRVQLEFDSVAPNEFSDLLRNISKALSKPPAAALEDLWRLCDSHGLCCNDREDVPQIVPLRGYIIIIADKIALRDLNLDLLSHFGKDADQLIRSWTVDSLCHFGSSIANLERIEDRRLPTSEKRRVQAEALAILQEIMLDPLTPLSIGHELYATRFFGPDAGILAAKVINMRLDFIHSVDEALTKQVPQLVGAAKRYEEDRLLSDRSLAIVVIKDCISTIVDGRSDQSIVIDTLLKLARQKICGHRALEALRELDQDIIVRAFLERRNHNPDFPREYREILEQLRKVAPQ